MLVGKHNTKVGEGNIQLVDKFKYLGGNINNKGKLENEFQERISIFK